MLTSHREKAKEQSYVKQLSNFTHFIEENKNKIVVCVFLSHFVPPQCVNSCLHAEHPSLHDTAVMTFRDKARKSSNFQSAKIQ